MSYYWFLKPTIFNGELGEIRERILGYTFSWLVGADVWIFVQSFLSTWIVLHMVAKLSEVSKSYIRYEKN